MVLSLPSPSSMYSSTIRSIYRRSSNIHHVNMQTCLQHKILIATELIMSIYNRV